MNHFGDMAWAARSGGNLRGIERLVQLWEAVRYRMESRPPHRSVGPVAGVTARQARALLAELTLPSSPLVARAAEAVTALGPAPLAGHALRTWAWGAVLGRRDGLSWDLEAHALAALLHDLGLARRTPGVPCFAVDGAQQARALLRSWGADDAQSAVVADAICLHLRVRVPAELGVVAHLVHAGAAVDVVGDRLAEIPTEIQGRVLSEHPRRGFPELLCDAFRRERREHRASRAALWVSLGFLRRVAAAPFAEGA